MFAPAELSRWELGTRGSAMALVQSQQFTDKKTPQKQRGFLSSFSFCAKFVLRSICKPTGAQHHEHARYYDLRPPFRQKREGLQVLG
jgi:hypothetical protein